MKAVARSMVSWPARGEGLDPRANFALEEALFLRNKGVLVRIWENRESVIIGRAQLARFETDVEFCAVHGIPIVRRFTAGGTVYNGPGNLNWSLFVGREVKTRSLGYESGPRAVFSAAAKPFVAALGETGVEARFEPPNSLATKEGKISGMAAYVSKDGFLCHGTLLVDADLARVKRLTTPSPQVLERRYTRSRDVRTANAGVDVDSFIHTFVSTLGDETGLTFESAVPEAGERAATRELLRTRYSRKEWNLGDPFPEAEVR